MYPIRPKDFVDKAAWKRRLPTMRLKSGRAVRSEREIEIRLEREEIIQARVNLLNRRDSETT